jgi:hypothetical protein
MNRARWLFPVAAVAFVMAGDFKATPVLDSLPFDLTFGTAAVVASAVGCLLVRRQLRPELLHVAVGFGLLLPSVFIADATPYGSDKILRFFTLTLLAVLAPVVYVRSPGDIEKHAWAWAGFSCLVVASAIVNPQASATTNGAAVTAQGVDTIGLGAAAGLVVIVMTLGLAWHRVPWFVALPLGGGGLYALLQSGSRGPLFSAVLAIAVGAVAARSRPKAARTAVLGALCLAGVAVSFAAAPPDSRERIMTVLQGRTLGTDVETRQSLYDIAVRSITEHPFGIGWGNFQNIAFANYLYPHDLFLEVLAEEGVFFGGLFLLWIAVHAVRARYAAVDHAGGLVLALVVFMIGTASVSGDINDNRKLFFALGLAIAARALVRRHPVLAAGDPPPDPRADRGPRPRHELTEGRTR